MITETHLGIFAFLGRDVVAATLMIRFATTCSNAAVEIEVHSVIDRRHGPTAPWRRGSAGG